jgi:hypothetical protein
MRRLPLLLAVLIASPLFADESNNKKSAVSPLGDIDGDGVPDLALASRNIQKHTGVVGVHSVELSAVIVPECVWLISGKSGKVLRTLAGLHRGDGFGSSLADGGDMDGDGIDDLIVGRVPDTPFYQPTDYKCGVTVVSCATGKLLFEVQAGTHRERLGYCVAGLGDEDGDGVPDFAASSPCGSLFHEDSKANEFDWRPGFVRVFSGADGSMLYQIEGRKTGFAEGEAFGACVCAVGDWDGDGRPDFAVSAPGRNLSSNIGSGESPDHPAWERSPGGTFEGGGTCGSIVLYSGRFGTELKSFDRTTPNGVYGWSLALAGDVDGDGKRDLLVGTLHRNVDVVSSATFNVLHHVTDDGYPYGDPYGYASSIGNVGDVDGDGTLDFVVGANEEDWSFDPGNVNVISGKSGARIWRFFDASSRAPVFVGSRNDPAQADEGYDACGCGDIDGDGVPDVAVVTQFSRELLFLSGKNGRVVRRMKIAGFEK